MTLVLQITQSVFKSTYKHQYPLQCSAFTYSGDVFPFRIDYAKEKSGGPFTTEKIEDMKIFLRIVIALGPVYVLQIPMSSFTLPFFGFHIFISTVDSNVTVSNSSDNYFGSLIPARSAISFLVYIWVIIRKRIPVMFVHLSLLASYCWESP